MHETERNSRQRTWRDKLRIGVAGVMLLGLPPVVDETYPAEEYSQEPLQQQKEIRILTANIHNPPLIQFYKSRFSKADAYKLLNTTKPDIACLQEITNDEAAKLPQEIAFARNSKVPLNKIVRLDDVGLALASTRKMENVERLNLSRTSIRPAVIADIDSLKVACLHLTDDGVAASEELQILLKTHPDLSLVMGDFNQTPVEIGRLMGDMAIASTHEPTLVNGKRPAIDRIFLDDKALLLKYWDSFPLETGSDHRAVLLTGTPSNRRNFSRKELR